MIKQFGAKYFSYDVGMGEILGWIDTTKRFKAITLRKPKVVKKKSSKKKSRKKATSKGASDRFDSHFFDTRKEAMAFATANDAYAVFELLVDVNGSRIVKIGG